MFEKIKNWWHGEDTIHENKPSDPFFVIGWYNKKHWTSRFAHRLVDFYLEHWKFIWGSIVAIFCASIKFL